MDAIKTFPKFTIFFIVLMILEILGLTVIPSYHIVSKPMIMAGLIGFYIFQEKRQNNAFITGLIFALLGDCFLMFGTDDMFMIGLTCFLIMQLCYVSAFNRKRRIPQTKDYIVPAVLVGMGLLVLAFLWNGLGELKWAVSMYTASIIAMAIMAYLRHPKLRGYQILFAGVCMFIISDALLGYNKFGGEFPNAQIVVMLTYMIAQYLIVTGEVLGNMKRPKVIIEPSSSFHRHKM